MKLSSRGFTLVELMIVIAIIGILAAALFPSLTAYLKRSRDAGRSANLNSIATALGSFYSDKERYPHLAYAECASTTSDLFTGSNYFPKGMPADPLAGVANSPCGVEISSRAQYGYGHTGSLTTKADIGYAVSSYMENLAWGNYDGYVAFTGTAINTTSVAGKIEKGTGKIYVLTN